MTMQDYLFRGNLAAIDPDVAELVELEAARQVKRLIMIPSESTIPLAVREALSSAFHNIYAEGYPDDEGRAWTEERILDIDGFLAHFRRYSDPRYYKGTEFADVIEALARRRVAELFATDRLSADKLYVNVQALSGAPANSAVYTALINPGDTIMGMNLLHGGHLSHGSPAARSGKQYKAVFYGVNPETELIDYEEAREVALQHRPKIVIGGYSSYPYAPNWEALRAIADEVGALLLADIAHVAGLTVAGAFPSPVGIADVITFTTHKTFGGPRGAVILTHRADLYKKLDRGVFPGEQGGPHMNTVTALAVAAKLAKTQQFRDLQHQTVRNAIYLADCLKQHGLRVVHNGTSTHLLTVDCKTLKGDDGTFLTGDIAARMLDLVGITCNRNTLPSDSSAARPTGIRLGTPWITQRGFREPQIERLAAVIATVLKGAKPFSYDGKGGKADARAKLDYATWLHAQQEVAALCAEAGIDYDLPPLSKAQLHFTVPGLTADDQPLTIEISGEQAGNFVHFALSGSPVGMDKGAVTNILTPTGDVLATGWITRINAQTYQLAVANKGEHVAAWLQALSDGFVIHDEHDLYGKIPGPVVIRTRAGAELPADLATRETEGYAASKNYFVGCNGANYRGPHLAALPAFVWNEPTDAPLKRTPLYALHKDTLGAKMTPFAGYDMPVWYSSVGAEHAAVRTAAGLFDVSHMGTWEVSGSAAEGFLNVITTNDVAQLAVGEAHYSYLLGVDGVPLDDIYVYKLAAERFMIVVNASNNDKDWAWVQAVRAGSVAIDPQRNGITALFNPDHVTIRDLRDPAHGPACRVDLALQGPTSTEILLSLGVAEADKAKLRKLGWSQVMPATIGGLDLIVSRTGYTGERTAYELFVHPDHAADLFKRLVDAGATPCGLAARDSLRTEAGLPLYGNELGGTQRLTPGDAGFSSYVKLWKPFFIGKQATIAAEIKRDAVVTRFRLDNKGVRPPHAGAALADRRGRVVGIVTSCSIDSEGYQSGQAYLKDEFATEGTPVFVIAASNGATKDTVALGDKVAVPDAATVLSKFPAKKK